MMILAVPGARFARAGLESVPLRYLGVISYGIYIYHLPCLTLVDRALLKFGIDAPDQWFLFGGIGLALTITVATISYLAIERPVLRLVHRYRGTRPRGKN